ncbi:fumarylacetoacetate hydrolase family protein [Lentzea sp. NBRC 102530]|uniref:2-keto-4-pentenoate hydratase n=1 Tax=Lentzea sp. NBRC 102530 TaxID=3032201 RepID=UPI0024A15387|nr:fumarylacetoacetate hydrolase family protein [Lentzea sp. NBRC 102530]GLY54337.1 putative hydratase/decarboxylase [Lentzea sp. NBRC 102530]
MNEVRTAAERLAQASRDKVTCAPVRDLVGDAEAYEVQQLNIAARVADGAGRVGRKIGLTSPAVRRQLGVDQPDYGVLLDDMAFEDGDVLPTGRLLQPRVEAEVAFVLSEDLVEGPFDEESVARAVGAVLASLEVVDSRVEGWDITFADTVADNASAGLYVLGGERKDLRDVATKDVRMVLSVNGEERSTGTGADCMGDPLSALAWLATTSAALGTPLRAGEVVLSGALGPVVPVRAGDEVEATITGLGTVRASFGRDA